jgi:uncharacterized protein
MSKLLLILLVMLVVIWLWRANRPVNSPKPGTPATAKPLEMVRCSYCAVHLPLADVVQGKKGVYCCADHLQRAES